MLTLTKGYKKPQSGDPGSVWQAGMETNIQQLNDHTHDGVDSQRLSSAAITAETVSILAAASGGWVSAGNGNYYKDITMPAALLTSEYDIAFRNQADGAKLNLGMTVLSSTTYRVFANDNTLDLTVFYLA